MHSLTLLGLLSRLTVGKRSTHDHDDGALRFSARIVQEKTRPYRRGKRGGNMLYGALVFLIIAIIAAIFGFGGSAVAAAGIAKLLFFIFLLVFIITLLTGITRR